MSNIFQAKIVLQATSPISFQFDFKKLDLNINPINQTENLDFTVFCDYVESICWKVSRQTHIPCIFIPFKIHLVYQVGQRKAVDNAVKELERYLPVEKDEMSDEDASSSPVMTKALECGMISALLSQGWTSLESGLMICGNIALMEEGVHVEAVSVGVQIEAKDSVVFIVAPDVIRFHRHRVSNFLSAEMKEKFDNIGEVSLEDWLWCLRDDAGLDKIKCFVLPTLTEGYMHGLQLPKDCLYIKVQFTSEDERWERWFPSSLVLKGSGLMPVPQTIRTSKVVSVLDKFTKSIEAWDFFDGGTPKFQATAQINSAAETSAWITAKDVLQNPIFRENNVESTCMANDKGFCSLGPVFSSLGINIFQNFRRPKPALLKTEPSNRSDQDISKQNVEQHCSCSPILSDISVNPTKIVPHFVNRIAVQGQNVPSGGRNQIATNKTQFSNFLNNDLAAIPTSRAMKADGPISQKALTEGRQCLLKVPSFARRKPSAVTVQRAGKAESKHALIRGNSKDAAAETTKLTMGKENLKGLEVPKKKLSEAKCKTIPVGLQKIPNKATVAGSTSGGKGIASKKKGAVTSTAAYQACDLAGNLPQKSPPENIKSSGYKIKVSKSHTSRILEANASTLPFALQQNEVSGSVNASQQVACTDTTFDNSFNGQMLSPETEKEMKRRKHPRTQYEYNASEVKTNEEELEYSLKKARPQKKVGPALRVEITEADNVIDSTSGAIPDAEIKVHNPKKRNSIALDITTVGEKVRDCHARGNLKSLTVPELKSFLSANKLKVGGKKEELIQRIIDLLSN